MPTRVMNKGGVEDGGFIHGISGMYGGDQRFFVGKKVMFKDVREEGKEETGKVAYLENDSCKDVCSSDESSSIGKNSDFSENSSEKLGDGEEVQSSYKGPLDAMEALEEVLPIRRGISRFYNGKSKSFASLRDASSSSTIKEIAKPENIYLRRRRSLLASNLSWDSMRGSSPLRGNGGGISKRVTSTASNRTTLALAVAMSNSESECSLSPRKKDFSTWRSFSLADLQQCAAVAISNSSPNGMVVKHS